MIRSNSIRSGPPLGWCENGTNGRGCLSQERRWSDPRRSAWPTRSQARRRERASAHRAELDQQYVQQFAERVREFYPRAFGPVPLADTRDEMAERLYVRLRPFRRGRRDVVRMP